MYAGLSGAVGRSQAGRCGGSSVAGLDVVPLADGRCVEIRPVSRADAQRLHAFVRALSPATRYRRFHGAIHELTPAMVDFLTDVDQRAHVALIALAGSAP
ncbi:MAG TPA: hypothetical protein VM491_22960, partial [Burkholderiaceae bacterium]|nr:hypothetical protein [Burkholderiaceae bacterium]